MNDGGVVKALAELFHKLQTGQSYGASPQPHQHLNSYGQPLGVIGSQIESGLEINGYARNNREQMAVNTISKHDRGRDLEARMKRKRYVTVELPTKFKCNKVLSLLNNDDVAGHDIGTECQTMQASIQGFKDRLGRSDMETPFIVPAKFELGDPNSTQGPYTNLLDSYNLLTIDKVKDWQSFCSIYAAPVEAESANWADDILDISMEPDLRALVNDDYEQVDIAERGAMTKFKIMTTHMMLENQEAIDSLTEYLRSFDICNTNNQNVSVAVRKIRAVVRTLEPHGLPMNLMRCLIDGFARADNEEFKRLCQQIGTATRSTMLQSQFAHLTPKQQIFKALSDLEMCYISLSTNKKWEGMGHNSSVFLSSTLGEDDGNDYARAMAVRQHRIPFDQWVKDIECNGCGKKGHIEKDCPDKKKKYDKTTTNYSGRCGNDRRGNDRRGNNNERRGKREAKFKKAFQIAMDAIGETSDGEDDKSLAANVLAADGDSDTDESGSDESLAAHAARMFSSLSKE